jgi:hypothetical protein
MHHRYAPSPVTGKSMRCSPYDRVIHDYFRKLTYEEFEQECLNRLWSGKTVLIRIIPRFHLIERASIRDGPLPEASVFNSK